MEKNKNSGAALARKMAVSLVCGLAAGFAFMMLREKLVASGNSGIWLASIIVVSINTGAYMAESVRGGIISIDPGQTEGAMAIGMTHVQTMTSVILP